MNCERCGKTPVKDLGGSTSGSWFECESCGHVFIVPNQKQAAANERIVTAAAERFLRSA